MPEVNKQDTAARGIELEVNLLDIPAVGRFVAAVDSEVDQLLTDDIVEMRLAQVRLGVAARRASGLTDKRGFVEELARYGYTMIRIWLQVVRIEMQGAAAMGRNGVGFEENEIHDLAKDAAARAIAAFRREHLESYGSTGDSFGLKAAFLSQCVRGLPDAYRSRQLRLGQLSYELDNELQDGQPAVGVHIVTALKYCVTDRREETAHLVRTWTDSDQECQEIIDLTRRALDLAVHTQIDPRLTRVSHPDKGTES